MTTAPIPRRCATTIKQAGLDIFQTFNQVGLTVKRETGGAQQTVGVLLADRRCLSILSRLRQRLLRPR